MDRYRIIVHIFLFIGFCSCFQTEKVARQVSQQRAKIKELQKKYKDLYGGATERPTKLWELDMEDRLSYPRGDKYKLHKISEQWIKYYKCCIHTLEQLTTTGTVAGVSITAYEGATVRIPCSICTSRLHPQVTWLYATTLHNLTYIPMEEKETAVVADEVLTIYRVQREDAGVYTCQLGATYGKTVVLTVVDIEGRLNPSVVRVFNSWQPWSACSRCGRWGRQRRYGMCHVALNKRDKSGIMPENSTIVCEKARKKLEAFPDGIGCRSKLLPRCLQYVPLVRNRLNIIELKMCRPPCETSVIFNVLTTTGVVLERANNSAGIYSLALPLPRQPPPVARDLVLVMDGERKLIKCKGTSLRDIPVTWRVGEYHVSERALDKESGGRVRVNAHDHIVFDPVWQQDEDLYSCWQQDVLVGEVKLEVWPSKMSVTTRMFLVFGVLGAIYLLHKMLRQRNNQLNY
ncbi:hypothetical protein O0L34_g8029 [Tuta absoluta]|nr:hypothetical protein O0L34_g8029 [Tuta absoluta]